MTQRRPQKTPSRQKLQFPSYFSGMGCEFGRRFLVPDPNCKTLPIVALFHWDSLNKFATICHKYAKNTSHGMLCYFPTVFVIPNLSPCSPPSKIKLGSWFLPPTTPVETGQLVEGISCLFWKFWKVGISFESGQTMQITSKTSSKPIPHFL